MTETPALDQYRRVITSKRDGTCTTCGKPTRSGVDYAAVDATGAWASYCRACGASFAAQVAGLIGRIEAIAPDAPTAYVAAITLPAEDTIAAVLAGTAEKATGYDVVMSLRQIHDGMVAATRLAAMQSDPTVAGLTKVANDATASPRNRAFAADLLASIQRYGRLTERQQAAAERMIAAQGKPAGGKVAPGVYVNAAGVIVKVQANRSGTGVYSKVWTGAGFEYQPGLDRDTSLRPITAEEAAAFGHQHDHCVFCMTTLTDDGDGRSVQVGYGPICARKYGLPWGV